jgi:hypothetical protein
VAKGTVVNWTQNALWFLNWGLYIDLHRNIL